MADLTALTEHIAHVPSCPKPIFYLASGPIEGPVIMFVHGWPELSISWRHQLVALGSLGFRTVAPDLRGYGRSYIPARKEEVEFKYNIADLIGLLDFLRGPSSSAVFCGHDWGAPITWSLAMHHPERVAGIVGLVVPHNLPSPAGSPSFIETLRKADDALQWDYQIHHNDNPDGVAKELDADIRKSCEAIFQATYSHPKPRMWNKYITMFDQRKRFKESGGRNAFFLTAAEGADRDSIVRDARMVTEHDLNRYVEGLERNGGFTVPNFYYLNHQANADYNRTGIHNGGVLGMPALMITAEYDVVCTPALSQNMEKVCTDLTRAHIMCGHWVQQECPREVNAALVQWLARKLHNFWQKGMIASKL